MTDGMRLPGSLAEIRAAPKGPQIGAFLDMDGTLFHGQSGRYITAERRRRGEFGSSEVLRALALYARGSESGHERFAELMDIGGAAWTGLPPDELEDMGQAVFERDLVPLIFPEMREMVDAHHRRGHTVVLSSAASNFQVNPIARHLGVDHVLCNYYIVQDGVLTGVAQRPVLYGPGKAYAVQEFAAANGIDLPASYFYADGDGDVALMYLVGHPRPTNPRKELTKVAEKRGWPILRFDRPGGPERESPVKSILGLPAQGIGLARHVAESLRARGRGPSS